MPVTEPIEFSFDAPTWSLGKSMAAHIAMGRIGEVYRKDLKDTIYQICGRRDEHWEMISTRKDRSIAAFYPGVKPAHSTSGEPDVRGHDGLEEGED